ncbi:unnamed protein product [Lactuca virosa]|uniref:Uncharacterized protein n=1 Tax=Lactuca virosa TaxID=75947 RepID=A0AAU9P3L1_9ASTR|nr:unnamed protein product [Lactuca virosa]
MLESSLHMLEWCTPSLTVYTPDCHCPYVPESFITQKQLNNKHSKTVKLLFTTDAQTSQSLPIFATWPPHLIREGLDHRRPLCIHCRVISLVNREDLGIFLCSCSLTVKR